MGRHNNPRIRDRYRRSPSSSKSRRHRYRSKSSTSYERSRSPVDRLSRSRKRRGDIDTIGAPSISNRKELHANAPNEDVLQQCLHRIQQLEKKIDEKDGNVHPVGEDNNLLSPASSADSILSLYARDNLADSNDISIIDEVKPSVSRSEKPKLREDLMAALGEDAVDSVKWGIGLHEEIANRWNCLASSGLKIDKRKQLMDKYPVPENCKLIKPPLLNEEVEPILLADGKKKDEQLVGFQRQLSAATTAIGIALTEAFSLKDSNKQTKMCALLSDSGRLLCDLQHSLSIKRRSHIIPSLKASIRRVGEKSLINSHLFGNDFSSRLKEARDVEKLSKDLQVTRPAPNAREGKQIKSVVVKPSSKTLNSKRPSQRSTYWKDGQKKQQRPYHRK